MVTGQQLFEFHCASCHKNSGQGQFLKGIPANNGTKLSEAQISHKIVTGKAGGWNMPTFPAMSKQESDKIAAYVKSL